MPKLRAYSASTLPHPLGECRELLNCKHRGRINGLLGNIVIDLDLNPVNARLQVSSRDRFLQGDLVADVAHRVGALEFLHNRFIGSDIGDVVFEGGGRLVRLLVHSEIIDLHPEIEFLIAVALEDSRLAVGGAHARTNLHGTDHKTAAADLRGRNLLHLVGNDEAGGGKFVFGIFRNCDAPAVDALAVAIHIFDSDVKLVVAGTERHGLPVDRCVLGGTRQQLGGHIDLDGVFERLNNLVGERGELAVDIDGAALDAFFIDEGDVAISRLNGDGNQHRIAGHFNEVRADVKRHRVEDDFGIDLFGQIRELDFGRLLEFGELFEPVELLGLEHAALRANAKALKSAAVEAGGLVGHAHLFPHGQSGVWGHQQGIFFRAIHRHVVFAAHARVDKLDDDFLTNAFDVAVAPLLKGEGRSFSAAFFHGALVGAAGGMRLDFVGLAENDVDAAAVRLPAWDTGGEVLVGVSDALVVLFLIFVLFGVGRRIAALPEGFDEVVALFVVGELLEGGALFVGDDVGDVLVEPLLVGLRQLVLQGLRILLALFFVLGAL